MHNKSKLNYSIGKKLSLIVKGSEEEGREIEETGR